MTSIAILMGNVPAAVGFGEGAELRQGLATIVIGGLVTSTLLTLLFVPVAYSLLESITSRFNALRQRWKRRSPPREQQPEEAESPAVLAHSDNPQAPSAQATD
jgi:hypothetical protein